MTIYADIDGPKQRLDGKWVLLYVTVHPDDAVSRWGSILADTPDQCRERLALMRMGEH